MSDASENLGIHSLGVVKSTDDRQSCSVSFFDLGSLHRVKSSASFLCRGGSRFAITAASNMQPRSIREKRARQPRTGVALSNPGRSIGTRRRGEPALPSRGALRNQKSKSN
ncbi:hypothetical protein JTE90_013242 [Oedothorax gibbosus]|uniref:Ribosomal protein L2 n=1 Tax=Oedothorax gibbosus TaxID=931172 RepID=A0AAV6VCW7_9ARAC|nr:hypothetical protein JTE90_013242 [Oedothorax gibbosus]